MIKSNRMRIDGIQPEQWRREGRPAIWQQYEILSRAAASDDQASEYVENEAIILANGESKPLYSGSDKFVNRHFLICGTTSALSDDWENIADKVAEAYGFTVEDDWCQQYDGLETLFRLFFKQDKTSLFGWVSLLCAHRPQPLRHLEDARIDIQTVGTFVGASGLRPRAVLNMAGVQCRPNLFLYKVDGPLHKNRIRSTVFKRRLSVPDFNLPTIGFEEWRYLPAIDGDHENILLQSRTPSMGAEFYRDNLALRTTGFFNLCRVLQRKSATGVHQLYLQDNTLEIDPDSGRIITIRGYEIPLYAGILGASVVEHVGLATAISDLTGMKWPD